MAGPSDSPVRVLERIEARRALRHSVMAMATLTVFLVVIWAATGGGYFWPMFPLAVFVVAHSFQAWRAHADRSNPEADVERETPRGPAP